VLEHGTFIRAKSRVSQGDCRASTPKQNWPASQTAPRSSRLTPCPSSSRHGCATKTPFASSPRTSSTNEPRACPTRLGTPASRWREPSVSSRSRFPCCWKATSAMARSSRCACCTATSCSCSGRRPTTTSPSRTPTTFSGANRTFAT